MPEKQLLKRAPRCPVAGYGWLYLRDEHARLLEGGPPQANPNHNISGQNPAYIVWGREQLQGIARDAFYVQQIEQRRTELERERRMAAAAVNSAIADLDRLETALADLDDLLQTK